MIVLEFANKFKIQVLNTTKIYQIKLIFNSAIYNVIFRINQHLLCKSIYMILKSMMNMMNSTNIFLIIKRKRKQKIINLL